MTTYTIKHKKFNDLADLLQRFLEVRCKRKMGRSGQALRHDFQMTGTIRVLEVTRSKENGWHPHVHGLVFSMNPNLFQHRMTWQRDLRGVKRLRSRQGITLIECERMW